MKVSFYFKENHGKSLRREDFEMQTVPRMGELVDFRSKKCLYLVREVTHVVDPLSDSEARVALVLEFVGQFKEGT